MALPDSAKEVRANSKPGWLRRVTKLDELYDLLEKTEPGSEESKRIAMLIVEAIGNDPLLPTEKVGE
jgi:hypothetical protein